MQSMEMGSMEWYEAASLGIACGVIAATIMPENWFDRAALGSSLAFIVAYLFNAIEGARMAAGG